MLVSPWAREVPVPPLPIMLYMYQKFAYICLVFQLFITFNPAFWTNVFLMRALVVLFYLVYCASFVPRLIHD